MTDDWILGDKDVPNAREFSDEIAWNDSKIAFMCRYAKGHSVLDIGCVQHNPQQYRSRFWLHKALKETASYLEGLDIYEEGVNYLQGLGFNIYVGDAQNLDMKRQFEVIIAGDLIEHLSNPGQFLAGCARALCEGGKLLLSTPNPWYWRNIAKAVLFSSVSINPEHTMWMCPRTLEHHAARYGLRIEEIQFGSRYARDRYLPLPPGIKHTTFYAALSRGKRS